MQEIPCTVYFTGKYTIIVGYLIGIPIGLCDCLTTMTNNCNYSPAGIKAVDHYHMEKQRDKAKVSWQIMEH